MFVVVFWVTAYAWASVMFSSLKAAKWESAAGVFEKYKPISSLVNSLAVFHGSAVIHSGFQPLPLLWEHFGS